MNSVVFFCLCKWLSINDIKNGDWYRYSIMPISYLFQIVFRTKIAIFYILSIFLYNIRWYFKRRREASWCNRYLRKAKFKGTTEERAVCPYCKNHAVFLQMIIACQVKWSCIIYKIKLTSWKLGESKVGQIRGGTSKTFAC